MEIVGGKEREVNEQLRLDEWSIDVPTIGNVYRRATKVLRYFNGLGRALKRTDWDNPRHWTMRAWTLQETRTKRLMVNACVPANMPFPLLELVEVGGRLVPLRDVLARLSRIVDAAESECGVELSLEDQYRAWGRVILLRETGIAEFTEDLDDEAARPKSEQAMALYMVALQWLCLKLAIWVWRYYFQQRTGMVPALYNVLRRILLGLGDVIGSYLMPVIITILLNWVGIPTPTWAWFSINVVLPGIWFTIRGFDALYNAVWAWVYIGGSIGAAGLYRGRRSQVLETRVGMGWRLARVWPFNSAMQILPAEVLQQAISCWLSLLPSLYDWLRSRVRGDGAATTSCNDTPLQWVILSFVIFTLGWWVLEFSVLNLFRSPRPAGSPMRYCSIITLANEMSRRKASNDHDKVAGLAYLMKCSYLPRYTLKDDIEKVWLRLVEHLPFPVQLELLFNFPMSRNNMRRGYFEGRSGYWIPTWAQISNVRYKAGVELLQPTWPPVWLKTFRTPTPARTYDPNTGSLMVPSCARILLLKSVVRSSNRRHYKVKVIHRNRNKEDLGMFYDLCDDDSTELGTIERIRSSKHKAFVLILHVYDCANPNLPISGVVAELLHPCSPNLWEEWIADGLGSWYNMKKSRKNNVAMSLNLEEVCTKVFGLTTVEANETFVVRKLGSLITDRPGCIGSVGEDLLYYSVVQSPVLFR
ncbi:hypothetical protein BDZ91DRAFT_331294 [Kalaharituber pfeilii]|nr:hypothetical protein BDZ91DRAFT_331294 [Kalaharituber pfeilii]